MLVIMGNITVRLRGIGSCSVYVMYGTPVVNLVLVSKGSVPMMPGTAQLPRVATPEPVYIAMTLSRA